MRSSCETEPISASRNSSVSERILASLSARATSRRSSVAAASESTSSTRWRSSAIASAGTLPRSMAMTPKSAVFSETRRISQILPVPSSTVVPVVDPACAISARTRSGTVFSSGSARASPAEAAPNRITLRPTRVARCSSIVV